MNQRQKNGDESIMCFYSSVQSGSALLSGPDTSETLDGVFSSTNFVTSSACLVPMVWMSRLTATESFAKASVRGISPCCVSL